MKIIFEFVGGPNDGKVLEGELGDGGDAERYFLLTNHGALGQPFKVVSDYAVETLSQDPSKGETPRQFPRHYYVVSDRLQEDDEILVRAEYLDRDAKSGAAKQAAAPRDQGKRETHHEKVQRFLEATAHKVAAAYGHLWPNESVAGREIVERDLALHLGHVLLGEDFSVFAAAAHPQPGFPPTQMLGVAPSQDWFLACQCHRIDRIEELDELVESVGRLRSFWLHPGLTIPPCRDHVTRIANHCQQALAVLAVLVQSQGAEPSELMRFWQQKDPSVSAAGESLVRQLNELNAHWSEPRLLRSFPDWGSFHLLHASFPLRSTQ